ncbi:MAG TPA: excinuclease ABC subunit UvrC [Rhodanobacteraceae bacterium]|nr:excinuclease ABC subunit UvrC [Rhodanobacteraceae bacterium]
MSRETFDQPTAPTAEAPEVAFDPAVVLAHLTHRPGVYRMLDASGTVIYVGKARDLKRRVTSYFQGSRAHDAKTIAMVRTVAGIEVTVTRTEVEALMLEYNLIKEHRPRFNVMLRDDKSYPYILLETGHRFPRLSFYRGPRTSKGRLFGPYPNAGSVRESLNQLHKLFQLRQCEDSYFENRSRPCMQHQIERCTAPCVGLISEQDYASDLEHAVLFLEGHSDVVTARLAERMEQASQALQFERAAQYRDQLAKLKNVQSQQLMARSSGDFDAVGMAEDHGIFCIAVMFFRGGRSLGTRSFFPKLVKGADEDEIIRAFLLQYYGGREAPREILVSHAVPEATTLAELLSAQSNHKVAIKARVRGDRARFVEMAVTNARHSAELKYQSSASYERQLEELCEVLELDQPPTRLECFDVSHTAGEATVASCVVFGPEGPLKSDYRRFNVADVAPGDDYGAMAQVLTRRYARVQKGEVPMPDVLFIDGGPGQLARAIAVMEELGILSARLVGVAKGQDRKPGRESLYLPDRTDPLRLPPSSPALHLIQQLRDEAHRFAITGHRARRQKARTRSPLEDVPGLGPKKRRELLKQFGGLQALTRAGIDDLQRVRGISRQLAEAIYERFHAG